MVAWPSLGILLCSMTLPTAGGSSSGNLETLDSRRLQEDNPGSANASQIYVHTVTAHLMMHSSLDGFMGMPERMVQLSQLQVELGLVETGDSSLRRWMYSQILEGEINNWKLGESNAVYAVYAGMEDGRFFGVVHLL